MPVLKLNYLPVRARAEAVLMILAYGNIPHEYNVISMANWKEEKGKQPFGQVPTLELPNGTVISQTAAITNYVSRLANIYPTDIEKAAKADMVYELSQEMSGINPILNMFEVGSEKYQNAYETYFSAFPARISAVQKILGDQQFFGGEQPSHADFGLFHVLDASLTVDPTCAASFPDILAWIERMKGLEQVKNYMVNVRLNPSHVGMERSAVKNATWAMF